jgi:hypothetical protein
LKGNEKVSSKDINDLARDLKKCKSFKVVIHNFNRGILKKLVLIRNEFKRKLEDKVEFIFDKDFKNDDLDFLQESFNKHREARDSCYRIFGKVDLVLNIHKGHYIFEILDIFRFKEVYKVICHESHFNSHPKHFMSNRYKRIEIVEFHMD